MKGTQKSGDDTFEEGGEDGVQEGRGGGQEFGVDCYEHEEGIVDVGAESGGPVCGGEPVGGEDAGVD